MKYDIVDFSNKAVGSVELSDSVFSLPERRDILNLVVRWQRSRRQAGTHQTRTISMISGTTRKPWKQKGTGRARTGSMRSPIFRGGATIHGPQTRSHAIDLPKKVRALGLKTVLSQKARDGQLVIVDSLTIKSPKTKDFIAALDTMKLTSALFVDADNIDENFARATSNVPKMDVIPTQGLNVYDILRRDNLIMTKAAIEAIEKRLK